ncbi:Uncharacterised protein [Legionella donaldsonii]|uniref:Uncharacterized protein n=1 Tax=Legionella donaldsonii TaxID=45060 RepID=A0A378IZX1_9GAMM|nr:hypothetical protein [Legionella donaldsonii]STX40686.1 Uncharacterised protein [Legionella donaldsonii]
MPTDSFNSENANNIRLRGIALKDNCRPERKRQRALQANYEESSYLPEVLLKLAAELHTNKTGIFAFADGIMPDGKYLYVRTLSGALFAAKEKDTAHHSYLSNGKKVTSAGYLVFEKGKLCLVSNESGHYRPTKEEMLEDLHYYYNLSKNEHLVYEDHTSVLTENCIKEFSVKAIVERQTFDDLLPLAIIVKDSRYNKALKKAAQVPVTVAPPPVPVPSVSVSTSASKPSKPNKAVATSHYLPDRFFLLDPLEYEEDKKHLKDPEFPGYDANEKLFV